MYKVTCGSCGRPNFVGYEISPIKSVLKKNGSRCKFCNAKLSPHDPMITVKPAE